MPPENGMRGSRDGDGGASVDEKVLDGWGREECRVVEVDCGRGVVWGLYWSVGKGARDSNVTTRRSAGRER